MTRSRSLYAGFLAALLASSSLAAQTSLGRSDGFAHPDGTTHYYEAFSVPTGIQWAAANSAAAQLGGYLATATSIAESAAIAQISQSPALWTTTSTRENGPWLGGWQTSNQNEPAGDWAWAELENFSYTNWSANYPDNAASADRIHLGGTSRTGLWADAPASAMQRGFVVEYSGPTVPRTVGLLLDGDAAQPGYTLFSPWQTGRAELIDSRGRTVNSWLSQYKLGMASYMIGNGEMIRCGSTANPRFSRIGGNGGVVEIFNWSGQVVWSFQHSTNDYCLHHDIEVMPNGNILMIAWELRTPAQAIAAGRDPNRLSEGEFWPEKIIEVKRNGAAASIVWEWHLWDHLVQDLDASKANFGVVANHPERIDINFPPQDSIADWIHVNGIDYDPQLDQIVISARSFNELWVIDHSTTTAEAASTAGGRSGKGGDILYRWGNPQAYGAGTAADRKLFLQHNAEWVPSGSPGAGNITIFNNGNGRPSGNASSVDEIKPPIDAQGNYILTPGQAFGPASTVWSYEKPGFYSAFVGGAQRLPNGNTLIASGWQGHAFEVDAAKNAVWSYITPVTNTYVGKQGDALSRNVFFRTKRYSAAEIDAPTAIVPQRALEYHDHALLVMGSTLPYRAQVGETVDLEMRSYDQRGKVYFAATSATAGLIAVDQRFARLGADPLLEMSFAGGSSGLFPGYFGVLDSAGRGRGAIRLPNNPALTGLKLYTVFGVVDNSARSELSFVSNTVEVEVR